MPGALLRGASRARTFEAEWSRVSESVFGGRYQRQMSISEREFLGFEPVYWLVGHQRGAAAASVISTTGDKWVSHFQASHRSIGRRAIACSGGRSSCAH